MRGSMWYKTMSRNGRRYQGHGKQLQQEVYLVTSQIVYKLGSTLGTDPLWVIPRSWKQIQNKRHYRGGLVRSTLRLLSKIKSLESF